MTSKGQATDIRRRSVIDATLRIIAADGVEAATTRRIAEAAGVGQSGLFYSFGSRDGLLAEVVEAGITAEISSFEALVSELESAAPGSTTIGDVIRIGLQTYLDKLAADPGAERALVSLALYAQRTGGIDHLARRLYHGYYELAARLLIIAANVGGIRWSLPPEELAPLVIVVTDGLTLAYLANPDRDFGVVIEGAVAMLASYVVD
ncbi:putative TetR family transcriptional regulator [Gordonia effusa NBRC 100432]|uniref:Putative TetR family transcriptional regulator n=1 Tax=Gordonia effusa NBRC 100432 TaxID=1077974 RepID=H0QXH6_9ACTN|nr:TetR/AcrR family transcriptional regulator [Gordonia effusa]GAB17527.1 putative TetR family transcriptional regulator [Gordonia effusa NBRC 100432]